MDGFAPYLFNTWLSARNRSASQVFLLYTVLLLSIAGVGALVYATGGIAYVFSHTAYIPIVLAGFTLGLRGAIVVALAGGLILGPWMPIHTDTMEMQSTLNWLYRSFYFVAIGSLVALMSAHLRAHIGTMDDTNRVLGEALEEFDSTLRAIPDLMFDIDEEGRVIKVWASRAELATPLQKTLWGNRLADILPTEAAGECRRVLREALALGQSRGSVVQLPVGDQWRWFDLSAAAHPTTQSKPRRVLMIARDVTDRKTAEEALAARTRVMQATFDNIAQGISVLDKELNLIAWNRQFQSFLEFPDELLQPGVSLEAIFRFNAERGEYGPGDPETQVQQRLALATRAAPHDFERQRPNGRILEISGRPMPDGGFVTTYADVTDRRMVDAMLRESQKLDAMGQLTGGLAHDFNNLLGVVVGSLDLIGERLPDDAELRRRHHTALEAALRGAEVTKALLAVARRQPMTMEMIDLNEMVTEMLPLMRSSVGAATLVRTQLSDQPLRVEVDAAGISNALLNLVINARDAMKDKPGEQRLLLRTHRDTLGETSPLGLPAGDYAVLDVCDTGAGMPEEVRQRAFEPFFTTKELGRGTGLGLAMVWGLAQQLGGTVRIDSEIGYGTTVQIYLPLVNR